MNAPLSLAQIVILSAYAAGMAGGQILFKMAALRVSVQDTLAERTFGLLLNWQFLLALALYFALAVLWVWILTFTPLSRAYPFVAIAFAITPILGAFLFAEPLSSRLIVGVVVILGGLLLVSG